MINKVFLLGRLVADPELRYTDGGNPYTVFRIAVNMPYKSRGEWKEDVLFINVISWKKQAEKLASLSKGERVFVVGELRQVDYERDGEHRSFIVVRAEKVIPFGAKKEVDEGIDF